MENEKIKIISNKTLEYLLNVVSIINTKTEIMYPEPIKPSDLEIELIYTSKKSKRDLSCKVIIMNTSFNPKRDLNNNKLITFEDCVTNFEFPTKICEIIKIDFSFKLRKNQIFQPDLFSFYIKEDKISEYKFPINKEYNLLFYSRFCDSFILNTISNCINFLETSNFSEKFETIYCIILIKKEDNIEDYYKKVNEKIKYFNQKKNKYKLIFLKDNKEPKEPVNIFNSDDSYFFIINSERKIIKLEKVNYFEERIKKFLNKENIKIKKDKSNYLKLFSNLYKFYKNILNLPYLFLFDSSYTIKIKVNDDLSEIYPIKLIDFSCEGELRTKEYQVIKETIEQLNFKKTLNHLTEIETFDIEFLSNDIKCNNCKKNIPDNTGQYYCYWCNCFYCIECTEKRLFLEENNLEVYRSNLIDQEHNLIYLTKRNKKFLTNLDKNKLGNNVFATKEPQNLIRSFAAICNGCHGDFHNKIRYLCINCRPGRIISGGFVDFCHNCFLDMRNNELKRKTIEDDLTIEDYYYFENIKNICKHHSHFDHIYLTLPLSFNGENYYIF